MNQKIITCASYCCSGSSAVTDLLGEFDDVFFMGDYEFRFIQDPDGVCDLAYNVAENFHRHNSGYAIKRYKKYVDFLAGNRFVRKYENFFDGQFKRLSYKYIEDITDFKFKGYWHREIFDHGLLFYFIEKIIGKFRGLLRNNSETAVVSPFLRNNITYVPYDNRERFFKITRDYIDNLFAAANKNNSKFIMVDQLVPPNNSERYLNLFNDIKIISVDRDPRDLYILEKTIWKGTVIPTDTVEHYCEWIKLTRQHRKYEKDDKSKVLRIYLEDMIYHYDDTVKKICSFLGIEKSCHTRPLTHFIPDISINNTKLWEKHPEMMDEINLIKEKLSEYCYHNY